jgi:pyruvate dehydrogenase E2 component (dihydrolipoamide acetyltransferase)/2-oxoisovalerate dehydrogenase E2 component (dihydrolipoyl transacylase)
VKIGDALLTYTSQERGRPPAERPPRQTTSADATAPASDKTAKSNDIVSHAVSAAAPDDLSVKAAPSVRRKARELGIDINRVKGTGPGDRVLLGDVERYQTSASTAAEPLTIDSADRYGTPGMRIKFRGLRRRIAERMVRAKQTIPHYGYVDEVNVTELVRLRNSLKEILARQGVKLTYLPFFVKAAAGALREVPIVNASLDEEAGEIVLHDRYHIGVAVATPGGLIVPVVRDADQKDVPEIAREIERLSEDARWGRSKLEDLRGGTFSITSIGGIGGLISSPVINYPEVGILGIGKIVRRPMYDQSDHLLPADMVYLSFSFDHRVLDGDAGATFGNAILRRLENPAALLVE